MSAWSLFNGFESIGTYRTHLSRLELEKIKNGDRYTTLKLKSASKVKHEILLRFFFSVDTKSETETWPDRESDGFPEATAPSCPRNSRGTVRNRGEALRVLYAVLKISRSSCFTFCLIYRQIVV